MKTHPCVAALALVVLAADASAQGPDPDLVKRFLENKAWYGQVVVSIQGEGSKGDDYYRSSYSIRREAEVTFKVKVQDTGVSPEQMEQMLEMSKGHLSEKDQAEMKKSIAEMRSRRTWMTLGKKRKDEDLDAVRLAVNDWMDSSGKEACGEPFPFRDTTSITGTANRKDECTDMLEIDIAAGTYTLHIDPKVDILQLMTIETHRGGNSSEENRPPLKKAGQPGNATYLSTFIGKRRLLPGQGKVLTGSEALPKNSLPCWHPDYGTLAGSITWVISPEPFEDVELVLKPESYDDWLPEAGEDEKTEGNRIAMKAILRKKGGGAAATKMDRLVVRLSHVSREPGICINWPEKSGARTPDLMFAKEHNSATVGDEGLRLEKKDGEFDELPFEVSCYDGGAWGSVTAEAHLTDGRTIFGILDGHPEEREVLVPKRKKDSVIADSWLNDHHLAGKKDDADEDALPKGDGQTGDGFSNYEEYRGYREYGDWRRGDPEKKDLFIRNEAGGLAAGGIDLFETITELAVHRLEPGEISSDRLVNFNYERGPHAVDQHGIRVRNAPFKGYCMAVPLMGTTPGTPKTFDFVGLGNVPENVINIVSNGTVTKSKYNVPTVAHELLHCCNVYHHGEEADPSFSGVPWKQEADGIYEGGKKITVLDSSGADMTKTLLGKPWPQKTIRVEWYQWQGVASGDVGCVMRYDTARVYTPQGSPDTRVVLKVGEEPIGGGLCVSAKATGTNLTPGRFGPCAPKRGNCKGQILVNDAKTAPAR